MAVSWFVKVPITLGGETRPTASGRRCRVTEKSQTCSRVRSVAISGYRNLDIELAAIACATLASTISFDDTELDRTAVTLPVQIHAMAISPPA